MNRETILEQKAAWIARRLGLSLDRAKLLAGIAFATAEHRA
jgi:hypothetical protein